MPKSVSLKTAGTTLVWSSTMNPLFKRFPTRNAPRYSEGRTCCKKSNALAGQCSRPPCCFLYQPHGRVSALATTADIVGDLAVYGTPWYVFWAIIQRGSWTVFKRLPLLFAVALPIGLAQKQPARCCLEALVAYFAYCFFLSEIIKLSGDNLGLEYPSSLTSASGITVIDGIKTLDTGIIGPLAVSATVVASMTASTMPSSRLARHLLGSSLVYLISFFAVFALAAISAAIVPYVYDVTDTLRHALAGVGPFGVGIFVFLERALEPLACTTCSTCRSTTTTWSLTTASTPRGAVCSPSSPIARAPLMSLRRGPVLPPPAGSSSLAFLPSQLRSTPPQNPSAAPASGSSLFPPSSPRWFAALPSHSSFSLCSPTPGSFCSTPSYRLALPQP